MLNFLSKYWYFIISGIMLLGLAIYWIIIFALNQKQTKSLDQPKVENKNQIAPASKNTETATPSKRGRKPKVAVVQQPVVEPVNLTEIAKSVVEKPKAKRGRPAKVEVFFPQDAQLKPVAPVVKAQQTTNPDDYVVEFNNESQDWVVRRFGSKKASKRFIIKTEACDYAKEMAKKNEVSYQIIGKILK
ncbi:MAG: DUF2188 domain-containing protein [Clostridia bacterium]